MKEIRKNILYFTKDKIWVGNYFGLEGDVFIEVWDGKNPLEAFEKIKSIIKTGPIRIILGNSLGKVLCFSIDAKNCNKETIFEKTASLVTEELSDFNFDWKVVGVNQKEKQNLVQVFVVSQDLLNNISYASKKMEMEIETIEPVSVILASQTEVLGNPHLIAWSGQENLGILTYKGIVYHSGDVSNDPVSEIKKMMTLAKERFNIDVAGNLISDWGKENSPSLPEEYKQNKMVLDPLLSMAKRLIEKGKDEDVLSIRPIKDAKEPLVSVELNSKLEQETDKKMESIFMDKGPLGLELEEGASNNKPFIILGLVVVVVLLVLGGIFLLRSKKSDTKTVSPSVPVPTQEVTLEPTSTPTVVATAVSAYKLQILNGSGVTGRAAEVRDTLKTIGFKSFVTGNASSFDLTQTEVQMKSAVPNQAFTMIKDILTNYSVTLSPTALPEVSPYDIVVTVGKKSV